MRRVFLTVVLLCACAAQLLTAQTPETPYTTPKDTVDEPLVVFRDRFVMDVYHTFWMGMPTEVDHMKFDPGVNFSAIWDFKIKKKPLAIGLGIGVSYYTQYSNALLQYDKTEDLMKYYAAASPSRRTSSTIAETACSISFGQSGRLYNCLSSF